MFVGMMVLPLRAKLAVISRERAEVDDWNEKLLQDSG